MTLGGRRFLLACAVTAAGICLALAVSLPFVRLTRLTLSAYEHSLISAVTALARANQVFLAGALLLLCIFLPLLKLLYLVLLATLPPREIGRSTDQLRALDWLGRWSPHDLLALAVAVALFAVREPFGAPNASGASFFLAAVLAMLLAYAWLRSDASAARMRTARAAAAATTRSPVFGVLLVLAAATFVLGATLPALRLTSAYAGVDRHSLVSIAWALCRQGEMPDGLAVITLGILLPGLRLLYLAMLALSRALPHAVRGKAVAAAELLGRHATADTMLMAVLLFYLVASGAADAALQPGAYLLAASAGLTMLAYAWTNVGSVAAGAPAGSLTARLAGLASPEP